MTERMTGGCQCGRVRYAAEIDSDEAYLCHCRMCQRATGALPAMRCDEHQPLVDKWMNKVGKLPD